MLTKKTNIDRYRYITDVSDEEWNTIILSISKFGKGLEVKDILLIRYQYLPEPKPSTNSWEKLIMVLKAHQSDGNALPARKYGNPVGNRHPVNERVDRRMTVAVEPSSSSKQTMTLGLNSSKERRTQLTRIVGIVVNIRFVMTRELIPASKHSNSATQV